MVNMTSGLVCRQVMFYNLPVPSKKFNGSLSVCNVDQRPRAHMAYTGCSFLCCLQKSPPPWLFTPPMDVTPPPLTCHSPTVHDDRDSEVPWPFSPNLGRLILYLCITTHHVSRRTTVQSFGLIGWHEQLANLPFVRCSSQDHTAFLLVFHSSLLFMYFSQLFYDGYQQLAVSLSTAVKAHPACPPSDRLLKVTALGLKAEEGEKVRGRAETLWVRRSHYHLQTRSSAETLCNVPPPVTYLGNKVWRTWPVENGEHAPPPRGEWRCWPTHSKPWIICRPPCRVKPLDAAQDSPWGFRKTRSHCRWPTPFWFCTGEMG